jgi:hypothetical protein
LGSVSIGVKVYDTASLGGTVPTFIPTGTVTYSFFKTSDCSGTATKDTEPLDATGNPTHSSTQGPLGAGSYSYNAVYNGDTNYKASAIGDCEPFKVDKPTPTISTIVFDASTNKALGAATIGVKVYDTAAIAGAVTGFVPTGTVTYSFFKTVDCTGTATTDTESLVNGQPTHSSTQGPLGAGSYSYNAVYNGDGNYNASGTGDCEPFKVAPVTPTISTVVYNAATKQPLVALTIPVGGSVYDTATLSGTVATIVPTGTVTYSFFKNGNCSGLPFDTDTVTLSNGVIPPSKTRGPLAGGAYSFQAVYNGDANYNPSGIGACEPFTAALPPLTPGYWKNHLSKAVPLIQTHSPFTLGAFTFPSGTKDIGNYITQIFGNMNCSNSSAQNAIGCLAGQLLAARLNVANGAPGSIDATINVAQQFLGLGGSVIKDIVYAGIKADGVVYSPSGNYSNLTANQRALAVALANDLSAYNASGV